MMEFADDKEKEVLELETRRRLYDVVRSFAGCHFREIERGGGLSSGTTKYHLAYLARHGLIQEERTGNNVRYFPREVGTDQKKVLGVLRSRPLRGIVLFIITHANCSPEQITHGVHIAPSTLSWHLRTLTQQGIVKVAVHGKRHRYDIAIDKENVLKLLIAYRASFLDALVDNVIEMWQTE